MASFTLDLRPGAHDWDKYRPTITRLYVDEKRTLQDVMDIMERDYQFSKGKKVYKTHFKSWGLSKNLGASDVPDILDKMTTAPGVSIEPSEELVIRGQRVTVAKAEHYLKRSLKDRSTLGRVKKLAAENRRLRTVVVFQRRMSALPVGIDAPDDLHLPETVIQIARQYIAGGCEGIWARAGSAPKFFFSETSLEWVTNLYSALSFFHQGYSKQAFTFLNACFDRFKQLLAEPTPGLFAQFYGILIWFPSDIGQKFLTYAAQMSAITLPSNHPLTLALNRLSRAGIMKVREYAPAIINSHMRIMAEWFQDCDLNMLDFNHSFYNHMLMFRMASAEATEAWQVRIAERSELTGCLQLVLRAKLSLAWTRCSSGKYEQALVSAYEIYSESLQKPSPLSHAIHRSCQALVFRIGEVTGKPVEQICVTEYRDSCCGAGICENSHMIPGMKVWIGGEMKGLELPVAIR